MATARLVKQAFKKKHGRLFCQVCRFDFYKKYGSAGYDYAEAHHEVAVETLREGDTTKLKDIAIVCANCHRMLHRRRPWLSADALQKIIQQIASA